MVEDIRNIYYALQEIKSGLEEIHDVIGDTRRYWQGEIGECVRDEINTIVDEYSECVLELMTVIKVDSKVDG